MLKSKFIGASKWALFGQIFTSTLTPIILLYLMTILDPRDFGIVAITQVIVSYSLIFSRGFGKALIKEEKNIEKSAQNVFWLSIFLGIILYLIIFFTAPLIANIYSDQRLVLAIRVQSIQVCIMSFLTLPMALLERAFRYELLFWYRFINGLLPNAIAIPFALMNWNYWALIIGNLLSSALAFVYMQFASKWKPKITFDFRTAKKLIKFGLWIDAELTLYWILDSIDQLIAGKYFGLEFLGLYKNGKSIAKLVFVLLFQGLRPVWYSYFARLQNNLQKFKQRFISALKLSSFSLPMGLGVAIIAKYIAPLLFETEWQGIKVVIIFLSIKYGIEYLYIYNREAYRAIGKPDIQPKILFVSLIYNLPVLIFTGLYSLNLFLIAVVSSSLILIPMYLYYDKKHIKIPIKRSLGATKNTIISALIMYFALLFIDYLLAKVINSDLLLLVLLIIIGISLFVLLMIPELKNYKSIIYMVFKKET